MTTARPPAARRRRTVSRAAPVAATELDEAISEAERRAIVVFHGERIPFPAVVTRIAALSDRAERALLFAGWSQALDAVNPLRERRLAELTTAAVAAGHRDLVAQAATAHGDDPVALAVELLPFLDQSETVYFAALRRYLALIDIEQGDATVADLWHVQRGAPWNHWFDARRLGRALASTLASPAVPAPAVAEQADGWANASERLAATGRAAADAEPRLPELQVGLGALGAGLLADAEWLGGTLGMAGDELPGFADFAAFMRLWRLRRDAALLRYELQAYRTDDAALRRAYYAGIVGLLAGVSVAEAEYLRAVDKPFASAERVRGEMLAAMAADALRIRHGSGWWRAAEARETLRRLADAPNRRDAVAQLGYDRLDWRPVLRQIRTQLIGEMSGYGGPNITTRAGTRKV